MQCNYCNTPAADYDTHCLNCRRKLVRRGGMKRSTFSNYCALVLFLLATAFFVMWKMQHKSADNTVNEIAYAGTFAITTGGAAIVGKVLGTIIGFVCCSR